MKLGLRILPYVCICAYVVFVFLSVRESDDELEKFYRVPYDVSLEVRDMFYRLQTLRDNLSDVFQSTPINLQRIGQMISEHNAAQSESIREIGERLGEGEAELVERLEKQAASLQRLRLETASDMGNLEDPQRAFGFYSRGAFSSSRRGGRGRMPEGACRRTSSSVWSWVS